MTRYLKAGNKRKQTTMQSPSTCHRLRIVHPRISNLNGDLSWSRLRSRHFSHAQHFRSTKLRNNNSSHHFLLSFCGFLRVCHTAKSNATLISQSIEKMLYSCKEEPKSAIVTIW